MVSIKDFTNGMARLEDAFGYDMPEKRMNVYFEILSDTFSSAESFIQVVDDLIMMCYRFPTIADFMERKQSVRKEL
jgi:hypothetical protein